MCSQFLTDRLCHSSDIWTYLYSTHRTCPNVITLGFHKSESGDCRPEWQLKYGDCLAHLCNSFVNLFSLPSLPAYSFSFTDACVRKSCRCRFSCHKSVWGAELQQGPYEAVWCVMFCRGDSVFVGKQSIAMLGSTAIKSAMSSELFNSILHLQTSNQTAFCANFAFIWELCSTLKVLQIILRLAQDIIPDNSFLQSLNCPPSTNFECWNISESKSR